MTAGRFPNLFLAGAPKCGTTSLAEWLTQHPEIFKPASKEPVYFRGGLTTRKALPESDYLALYSRWDGHGYALDASTHYFYSETAASEIKSASPDARIIIVLRDPAEATHSMYHQLRFTGAEDVDDFAQALAAEHERSLAIVPLRRGIPESRLYSRVYAFEANIRRYLEVFGQERVRVILLDDLKTHPRETLAATFAWLGLDPGPAQTASLEVRNGPKTVKSRFLLDLAMYPPSWLGVIVRPMLAPTALWKLRMALRRFATRSAKNPPLAPDIRRQLTERHRKDVEWVEGFLRRDLSHWKIGSAFATEAPDHALQRERA